MYKCASSTPYLSIWWYTGLNRSEPCLLLTRKETDGMSHAACCSLCSDQGMSDRFSVYFPPHGYSFKHPVGYLWSVISCPLVWCDAFLFCLLLCLEDSGSVGSVHPDCSPVSRWDEIECTLPIGRKPLDWKRSLMAGEPGMQNVWAEHLPLNLKIVTGLRGVVPSLGWTSTSCSCSASGMTGGF